MSMWGAIEAGGTKCICGIGTGPEDLRTIRIHTTTPGPTLAQMTSFLCDSDYKLRGIGIGTFGPLDLDPASPGYGTITGTPKEGWAGFPIKQAIEEATGVAVAIDTDVNAAAMAEARWGAAKNVDPALYVTVGTGIGGGALVHGRVVQGLVHPEMGHILIPHDRIADPFEGCCPYHRDCLEGLAGGVAVEQRWGVRAETLAADHPAWQLQAGYLALGLVNWICTLSPRRILIGGGLMRDELFPLVRRETVNLLNGYIQSDALVNGIDTYIVPPALGPRTGVLGALALAIDSFGQ